VIEEAGVGLNDPRLKEIMENITELQRKSMKTEELAKDSYFLDKETFKKIVSHNCVMLHRIMTNDFVIQQFKNFWDEILNIYEDCKSFDEGDPADYIPQLARANRSHWGVSVCTVDGQRHSAQLIFNFYLVPIADKPHNPMINSGAIVTCSLLHTDLKLADRFDNVSSGDEAPSPRTKAVSAGFLSERETADRNFCLGYYMKENGCFPAGTNVLEVLDFYFQLCSVEITCESGAVIAATLANGGICPLTGERVLSTEAVQDTLSLMHSCGMYDYSGQFAFKVGLPAKSGVSGVILLVVPNLIGIAMWSPPLDKLGNSCRGIKFCKELVHKFAFHNYDSLLHSTAKLDPRRTTQESRSQEIVSLLFSAQNNDVTALRRVCMAGVDMNQTDYDGRSALHIAAAEGHCDVVSFLLEFGQADYSIKD
uniref:glutaminase n=1 Tax=Macrostomum lignano TaxID=282301 RepID=A0A1I8HHN6_9PLAT